jgi:hypothetical protein
MWTTTHRNPLLSFLFHGLFLSRAAEPTQPRNVRPKPVVAQNKKF